MAGGLLEPIGSQNIKLSDSVQKALKDAGHDIKTFDELVGAMVGALSVKTQLQNISERLNNLSAADLKSKASAYGLKSGSVEASKLATKTATITREGDNLTYDYNAIIKGTPSTMSFVGATASVTGGNGGGRTVDAGNTGVLKIPSAASSAKLEVSIQTGKGVITLARTILVPEEDGTQEVVLDVNDYTTSISDMYISEHLEVLSAEVAALRQKISG